MGSVNWRKRGNRYQVAWRLDDGSQGAKTVATKDEALDLVAEKRLEMSRSTWQGRRRGRLPFSQLADEWWAVWSTDPSRSPTTLAATEIRLRRHVRPFFGDRPIEAIRPMLIRQWQNQLPGKLGYESLMACRSILFRILQLAEDEGAITANPLRRVPPPKRRADPERVLGQAKRGPIRRRKPVGCSPPVRCSGGIMCWRCSALGCGSASSPACAVGGST